MSTYSSRQHLKAVLTGAGYVVHDHMPDVMEPPCLVIEPREPYVEQRDDVTFADIASGDVWLINLDVWIFLEYADANEPATNAGDTALQHVVTALQGTGWEFAGAGKPGLKDYLPGDFRTYGLRLSVQNTTTLT